MGDAESKPRAEGEEGNSDSDEFDGLEIFKLARGIERWGFNQDEWCPSEADWQARTEDDWSNSGVKLIWQEALALETDPEERARIERFKFRSTAPRLPCVCRGSRKGVVGRAIWCITRLPGRPQPAMTFSFPSSCGRGRHPLTRRPAAHPQGRRAPSYIPPFMSVPCVRTFRPHRIDFVWTHSAADEAWHPLRGGQNRADERAETIHRRLAEGPGFAVSSVPV